MSDQVQRLFHSQLSDTDILVDKRIIVARDPVRELHCCASVPGDAVMTQ